MEEKLISSLDRQVGANHYKEMGIQPWEIALKNKLDPWEHSSVKYILRHRRKNRIQDLEKAIHCIEFMIENYSELYK